MLASREIRLPAGVLTSASSIGGGDYQMHVGGAGLRIHFKDANISETVNLADSVILDNIKGAAYAADIRSRRGDVEVIRFGLEGFQVVNAGGGG